MSLSKTSKAVREYLAYIGSRGGSTSRRRLSKAHAKQMVVIREALRAARKEGRTLSAKERKRLALPPADRAIRRRVPRIKRRTFFHPTFP